jgi:hypothetical protein
MAAYSQSDLERIAAALGVSTSAVEAFAKEFEAAALWFLAMRRPFEGKNPGQLRKKLEQVAKDARRLLKQLGIEDPNDAMDGPGDRDVFDALGLWTNTDDDDVAEATGRLGRLVTLLEAIDAAKLIDNLARQAADETSNQGRLIVPPGNSGDRKTNAWIADMMVIYTKITGKDPRTSVGAPGSKNAGIATGPLVRFLQVAGEPLGISLGAGALRKRVRTILEKHRRN